MRKFSFKIKVLSVVMVLSLIFAFAFYNGAYATEYGSATNYATTTASIQAMIDSAALNPEGGVVELDSGTYWVSNLKMKSRVTLKGKGRSTILKSGQGHTSEATISLYNANVDQICIRDLMIDGNKDYQSGTTDGIKLHCPDGTFEWSNDSYYLLENIFIKNCSGTGINIPTIPDPTPPAEPVQQNVRGAVINNVVVRNCWGNGMTLSGSDNFISNCTTAGNCNGFYVNGGNYSIMNSKSYWNRNIGLYLDTSCTGAKVANYEAQEEYVQGVYIGQCTGAVLTNIISDTNGHNNGTPTNLGIGVGIDGSKNCTFSNIVVLNRDSNLRGDIQYAFKFYGAPTNNTITAKVKNMSTTKVIEYNSNSIPAGNTLTIN